MTKRKGGKVLGKGEFGQVNYKPRYLCDNEPYGESLENDNHVSKLMPLNQETSRDDASQIGMEFANAIIIEYKDPSHAFFPSFHQCCHVHSHPNYVSFVYEYAGDTLLNWLNNRASWEALRDQINRSDRLNFFVQLLELVNGITLLWNTMNPGDQTQTIHQQIYQQLEPVLSSASRKEMIIHDTYQQILFGLSTKCAHGDLKIDNITYTLDRGFRIIDVGVLFTQNTMDSPYFDFHSLTHPVLYFFDINHFETVKGKLQKYQLNDIHHYLCGEWRKAKFYKFLESEVPVRMKTFEQQYKSFLMKALVKVEELTYSAFKEYYFCHIDVFGFISTLSIIINLFKKCNEQVQTEYFTNALITDPDSPLIAFCRFYFLPINLNVEEFVADVETLKYLIENDLTTDIIHQVRYLQPLILVTSDTYQERTQEIFQFLNRLYPNTFTLTGNKIHKNPARGGRHRSRKQYNPNKRNKSQRKR